MSIRCSEKACPFQALDGTTLCRQHQRFFTWDISMEDRGIEAWSEDFRSFQGMTVGGLVIHNPKTFKKSNEERMMDTHAKKSRVLHQHMASGFIIKKTLTELESIGDIGKNNVLSSPFASEELLIHTRYEGENLCVMCGRGDLSANRYQSRTSRIIFQCRLCLHQHTVTSLSIFDHAHLELNRWLYAMCLMAQEEYSPKRPKCISLIQRGVSCSYNSAMRIHNKLRASARTVGLSIGNPDSNLIVREGIARVGNLRVPSSWVGDIQVSANTHPEVHVNIIRDGSCLEKSSPTNIVGNQGSLMTRGMGKGKGHKKGPKRSQRKRRRMALIHKQGNAHPDNKVKRWSREILELESSVNTILT